MNGQPFVRYVLALIAGIILYVAFPSEDLLAWTVFGIGGFLLIWGIVRQRNKAIKPIQITSGFGGLLMLMALGWAITYQHTAGNRPDNLIHLSDTLRAYEGVVAAQPEERARTYRVELEISRGCKLRSEQWQALSGRVILYLDKENLPMPRYGEVWLVSGSPRTIDPPLNPGEFNYKRYLSYRNIYHQQYLRAYQRQVLAIRPQSRIMQWATTVNRWADSVLTYQIGTRPEFGVVNAMILGVRDDLDTGLYQAYSAAGAVHILSVSGLHVGILFTVLTFLLGFLAKSRRGKVLMAVVQLTILWFYALVTGFSPPVLRSAGMFTLLILANVLGRQQQLPNTLGASAFFILCFDPYALFSAGFQLSYLAVAGIGLWQPALYQSVTFHYKWADWLWKLTSVALVAQLITFPLGVFYFHQFPTYFLLANPVVIVLSEVLLPLAIATLALSGIPFLNSLLGWFLQKIALILNEAVTLTSQLPGASWDGLWLTPVTLLLVYVGLLFGVALLQTRKPVYMWATCLSMVLLAGLLCWDNVAQANQRRFAVHFLPHKTALSLTEGRRSTLLTDLDSTDTRSFDFYLKNTFGQWGVSDLTRLQAKQDIDLPAYYQTQDFTLWVWRGKTFMLVNKLTNQRLWRLPAVIDYLVIRRNALRNWNQLDGRIVARHIIFDDSNKTPLTDRLLQEAGQEGLACYSVRQMGAYVAELD